MSAAIRVNVSDLTRLGPRVQRFLQTAADTGPLKEAIGLGMVANTNRRFEESKDPEGRPWEPARRGGKPLVDSGLLRDSITYEVIGDVIRIGTNRIYAAVHQFGATIKPKDAKVLAFQINGRPVFAREVTIPARPFLGINDEDISDIRGAIADFIIDARREAR